MAIVKLHDIDENSLSEWAIENGPSCRGWLIYENPDAFSFDIDDENLWMIRYEFEFADERDAILFQLRWQGQ